MVSVSRLESQASLSLGGASESSPVWRLIHTTAALIPAPRYNASGKARHSFHYTPLIPQLQGLFRCPKTVSNLRYRRQAERAYDPNVTEDVFDGENYRSLRATQLSPNNELLQLEAGVYSSTVMPNNDNVCEPEDRALPGHNGYNFVLRAFVIIVFGDIPAVAKLLLVKGHNALTPCRACYTQGVLCRLARNSVYYIPLRHPDDTVSVEYLHMRTHQLFLAHYDELETTDDPEQVSKDYGINGRSVLARLKSIDLATSFPYDIMHLLFENLVPNMIRHWIGEFKGLDQGTGRYEIDKRHWAAIGNLTASATKTIPSSFVGTLPNIAQDRQLYKAEAYAFWIQYLAPILLKNTLPNLYYDHLLLMREIILRCLQLTITRPELDELQLMVNQWVADYERFYYQYQSSRLPACPLTIHALLHMPFYLRRTGPLWASWAFVMERFCGHLLPAVKNRTRPYEHLNNYVQRRAQMQVVSKKYQLPSLAKPFVNYRYENGEQLSSREVIYPDFTGFVLGTPVNRNVELTTPLLNQMVKFFAIFRTGLRQAQLRDRINQGSLVRHGRLRMVGDGDSIRTADLITRDATMRDNSYLKYDLLPDANATYRNREDIPFRQTQYSQLLDIYYIQLREDDDTLTPYLLARVQTCETRGQDAASRESPVVTYTERGTRSPDIIHANTIIAVVGRIRMGTTWAIVDRSRGNARTQFVDDDGNIEFDAGGDRKHSIHNKFILPKHSVHLSHVCSRWRYISNGAAVLWSHIDLSTSQNLNRRLFTRAKVFTSRAGETPLDIHIIERKEFGVSCGDAISDLVEFLTPIASRVRSVKINLNSFYLPDTKELCTAVFATCFGGATPGALKRLELYKGSSSFKGGFIKSVDDDIRMSGTDNDSDDEDGENIKLNVSRETLEDVWRPITVMHLRGFYPHWASRAYHGLVELRLAPTDQTISEFALAAILAASPSLRVLELGLSITDPLPEGSPNIPVRLNELELLIARRLGPAKIDSLFGLVDLSSKPLDIVVVKPFDRETEIENELEPDTFASGPRMAPFLSRSNVARVCVVGLEGYEEAIELLNFAPGISTLILEQFEATGLEETIDRELVSEEFSLHTLCLWGASRMAVDNLRLFVEIFQIQKLQLWGCRFRGHGGSRMVEQESVESELIDICPEVELRPSTKPHPDHNWDLIDIY
ncbi:Dynein heavy chain, cytoplasmic [Ceratobasidium theobromae]|uniref:Dynein heavy chain, cytoplasmic n=1 Tax=Ceratobasidium theobromae TaxID=1582974 RepID=A0A5N5QPM4_9AGAM|nr:Dynein heavy chain, cytoplasmic [Ceratobasidium theobromae]